MSNERPKGIKYPKNEIFLDVIENLEVFSDSNGKIISAEVHGRIVINSKLSGMPCCVMAMNHKPMMRMAKYNPSRVIVELMDLHYHPCVEVDEKLIDFTPPDGEFELANYRVSENVILPFEFLKPCLRVSEKRKNVVEVSVALKCLANKPSRGIVVRIPCPKNSKKAKLKTTKGNAKFDRNECCVIWKLKKLTENPLDIKEVSIKGEIILQDPIADDTWSKSPITLTFDEVSDFTSSRLEIRFLKVKEPSYEVESKKRVKYYTRNGSYQHNII